MEDERSVLEKIIAGEADLKEYDLDSDFDHNELRSLLDSGLIEPHDLSDWTASDMILDGSLSYDEYPFEKFTHYEQVRQLEQKAVSRDEFKAKAELEYYDGDDWLLLLGVWPELDAEAPWDMIRDEARANRWFEFLAGRPECAEKADWKRIFEQGALKEYFSMLAKQPGLFEFCPDRRKVLEADSALWVELLIRQPRFAEIYPMEELDEVDEVEHLLLHRPELTGKLTWDEDNPPVKLFIANAKPDLMEFSPDLAWFFSTEMSPVLQKILKEELFYRKRDAERYANLIAHKRETFAGVYSTRTAEKIIQNFQKAVAGNDLPLTIRMEAIHE